MRYLLLLVLTACISSRPEYVKTPLGSTVAEIRAKIKEANARTLYFVGRTGRGLELWRASDRTYVFKNGRLINWYETY